MKVSVWDHWTYYFGERVVEEAAHTIVARKKREKQISPPMTGHYALLLSPIL